MASYNGAKHLQAQLDSFLAQTRQPDELVISDDGSADQTLDIVQRFAEMAPFQVILSQNERKLGYAGNFNLALLKTTGDLVFLSDQDDVWFPEKIERMSTLADVHPEALVLMNDAALTDAHLNEVNLTKLGQIRSAGYTEHNFVMGCCAVVRRELLDLCLPIPDDYPAHDNWIVEIADRLGRKRVVADVLQYYRRHSNNESQWIVNRTMRVTRWDVLAGKWRSHFAQIGQRRNAEREGGNRHLLRSPEVLMFEWVRDAVRHAPPLLKIDLKRIFDELEREALLCNQRDTLFVQRLEIRKLGFLPRSLAAYMMWRAGNYQLFSGFQSAIRDILLP